jgi:hypothetical protein
MKRLRTAGAAVAAAALLATLSGCTGGQETSAGPISTSSAPPAPQNSTAPALPPVDPRKNLIAISPAIPVYEGAVFRPDLTQRDAVMIRNQYGPAAEVYTLATSDSYPQVYHYYVVYLAQFRKFNPPALYPPENQNWRTLQVNLSDSMQDPFVPGDSLGDVPRQVILQLAETEGEPTTVIRYIVTAPNAAAPTQVAAQ